ncbi:MAG: adenylate/guanylate cyclase domain-containing protein [Treponema sp.]|nr:adenylate/guanylate cyclase domain-containing protein [Treponema sp.]
MSSNKKRCGMEDPPGTQGEGFRSAKIRFSIGAKLITIISFIVVISLGSITALVSWLVQSDLRVSAEDHNFEMNRQSSMEAETMLINVRSGSRVLIQNVMSLAPNTASLSGAASQSVDFFFAENPQIAAVYFVIPGMNERLLFNGQFFSSRGIDESLITSYFPAQRDALGRAVRGETLLQNAAPHFSRALLALYFPFQNSAIAPSGGVGAVLFTSETINDNFAFGTNQSWLINSEGDILSHPDFQLVKDGSNIINLSFIKTIIDSNDKSRQQLLEADFGVLLSETRKAGGIFSPIWENLKKAVKPLGEKIKQFLQFVNKKLANFIPSINKSAELKENSELNKKPEMPENSTGRKFLAYTKLNTAGAIVITSIEYDKVFEGINATTRRNIYLTISVLSISIIFIWFFSKTISIPLKSLAGAAELIEGGKFDLEFDKRSNDEIGVLTTGFEKMCSALNVFGRFTNRDVAVKAMRGEINPGGLPKHGTVFFSDIREFTAKSEGFTKYFGAEASDKIVYWLNSYFSEMIDCVEKTNGVVDKFIGDAVMAHWGTAYSAGSPRKDAFNCVKSALMMRKALFYLNRSRRAGDPANPLIRIGCGINSGIVTAGQLGSDKRMEYTVIGDPVNLASRIEALTKPLGADILISEDTWKLVGDRFICEEMPSVTVKGKAKPVRIFAVVNFTGEIKGPQTLDEVRSILGIDPPVLEEVDVNEDEKKYKIGTEKGKD